MDKELEILRGEIDETDKALLDCFARRMEISKKIGEYKRAHELTVYAPERERELLARVGKLAGTELSPYAVRLYDTILLLSREYQSDGEK